MEVEVNKLIINGYNKKDEFQKEVIKIILSEKKWDVYYMGRVDSISPQLRAAIFYRFQTGDGQRVPKGAVKKKWEALIDLLGNPTFIIIMWKRLSKYIRSNVETKNKKLKKDGSPKLSSLYNPISRPKDDNSGLLNKVQSEE